MGARKVAVAIPDTVRIWDEHSSQFIGREQAVLCAVNAAGGPGRMPSRLVVTAAARDPWRHPAARVRSSWDAGPLVSVTGFADQDIACARVLAACSVVALEIAEAVLSAVNEAPGRGAAQLRATPRPGTLR